MNAEPHPPTPSAISEQSKIASAVQLTAVDLFSGIGGFHIAASQQGIKTIFACDSDKSAAKCYADNLGLPPYGDIHECEFLIPRHDILMAGVPCQPFSIIGKGAGFQDQRGMLVHKVAKIAGRLMPKAIVIENVKQLSTHNGGQTLKAVAGLFEIHGYTVVCKVLNALHFGLPQNRERTIIVCLLPEYGPLEWPCPNPSYPPLSEILETDVDARYIASSRIQANRKAKHTSQIEPPAIWHQNITDTVTSKPFSPTLRANASYNYLLVDGERRLTERELLRLQGFPDWFQPSRTYTQTRKQTGNAMPVPMASAVLKAVKRAIIPSLSPVKCTNASPDAENHKKLDVKTQKRC